MTQVQGRRDSKWLHARVVMARAWLSASRAKRGMARIAVVALRPVGLLSAAIRASPMVLVLAYPVRPWRIRRQGPPGIVTVASGARVPSAVERARSEGILLR